MAYYRMEEMPDLRKTGKKIKYPKFVRLTQASTEEVVKRIIDASSFTEGDVVGVVRLLGRVMGELMAKGSSVKLEGIGVFTPALQLCEGKEREETGEVAEHRNARSIEVGRVNFRADKQWVRDIDRRCYLKRESGHRVYSSHKYTPEERRIMALDYLDTHPFLTVSEYQNLTGLLRTAASTELRQWAKISDSGIGIAGKGVHRVYIKK